MMLLRRSGNLSERITALLYEARKSVVQAVNHTMVRTYYEIGRMIVEEEQQGKERATYGKQLIKKLSQDLSVEFGKGFSQRNLEQMRKFYLVYTARISQTLSAESSGFKLSWSHYLKLMRIDDELERKFYLAYTPRISQTLSAESYGFKLSRSHYLKLM